MRATTPTSKAESASAYNHPSSASGPELNTRQARSQATESRTVEPPTWARPDQWTGRRQASTPVSSGTASGASSRSAVESVNPDESSAAQGPQAVGIQTVECLVDPIGEDTKEQHADEQVEEDAQFDSNREPKRSDECRQVHAVFHDDQA